MSEKTKTVNIPPEQSIKSENNLVESKTKTDNQIKWKKIKDILNSVIP